MNRLTFAVYGDPEPAGSKRAFVNPNTGKPIVTDANAKAKPWQAEVKVAARQAVIAAELELGHRLEPEVDLIREPVRLSLVFYRPRPKAHFGTGRNAEAVRPSAPARPATRPDALKLARAVEDALTGVLWADDSQIVDEVLQKHYGEPARCEVMVEWPAS